MARLSLSFLGTFQVILGDEPITYFRSANVQGLLAYLALHPGRAISRDVLATLFWPNETDSIARTNFRQTLYQLRKVLQKGEDPARPFYIVSRQAVQFNPESDHACDVTAFLRALKQGDLAMAVTGYSGDLLPGFSCDSLEFEDWLRRERERLHSLALDAMQQRTEWLLGGGRLNEAKAMAQQQLSLEPWRELAHRQLIKILALAADRQGAQAQFEACKAILEQELGVEPDEETTALAEQIARGSKIQLRRRPQHNLIAPVTAFFGRETDLAEVRSRIADGSHRLVTLVGEGGLGKTRLALELAWQLRDQFPDGTWLVSLVGLAADEGQTGEAQLTGGNPPVGKSLKGIHTPLQDAIAMAISRALDHPLTGSAPPKEQLIAFLRQRRLLLVLDNFEQLLHGADIVLDLLHHARHLCVLCTSRFPLNFQAEWVYPLERLPFPPIADPFLQTTAVPRDPGSYPAVQLFVDRAQRANGRFRLTDLNRGPVLALCRLLSGLPLALELAAAALRNQSETQLLGALQQSMDSLSSGRRDIPPRHRSLRAVFDSSWDLLSPEEQYRFAKLSIFQGPFSVAAAAAVTDATFQQLQNLQEKSLLQADGERFLFHDLLRQFASEKLAGFSHQDELFQRFCQYYLRAVADLALALNGDMPHLAVRRIAGALENVHSAWQTAVSRSNIELLQAALVPLSDFYQIRGLYREGLRNFGAAAAHLRQLRNGAPAEHSQALAQLLTQQAAMYVRLSDYSQAFDLMTEAWPLAGSEWLKARLNITWGEALWRQGALAEAETKVRAGLNLAESIDSGSLQGIATYHLGVIQDLSGNHEASLAYLEEALGIWRRLGNRRWEGFTLNSMGSVAYRLDRPAQAKTALEEALLISQANDDRQARAMTLNNLSMLATGQKEFSAAKQYLTEAMALAEMVGDMGNQALLAYNLGWNAIEAGWEEEAQHYAEISLDTYQRVGNRRGESNGLQLLGLIAAKNGRHEAAIHFYQQSLTLSREVGDRFRAQETLAALAQLTEQTNKKARG